jgi:hypothetical protein
MQSSGEQGGVTREEFAFAGSTAAEAHVPGYPRFRRGGALSRTTFRGGAGGRNLKPGLKTRREICLEIAAREYVWLWDRRHGSSLAAIASREDVSISRVRFGLARARAQERHTVTTRALRLPRLVPLFPIGAYTPQSTCAHRRPIEPGSAFCCMVCHESGMDRHPALRRDPRTEPAPEPKPRPVSEPIMAPRETRKERRQRLFGARC